MKPRRDQRQLNIEYAERILGWEWIDAAGQWGEVYWNGIVTFVCARDFVEEVGYAKVITKLAIK